MKKKLILVISLVVIMLLFTACGKESYKFKALQGGPSLSDPVIGNNSLAVQKGSYVYMVNGVAAATSGDNKFGTPIKGAIYRLKLSSSGEVEETLLMAPKVFYSRNADNGLYIEGNKLFYMSPSTQKDKSGSTLYYYNDIFSVNLDGTGTKKVGTVDTFTWSTFVTIDGKVYFLYQKPSDTTSSIYSLSEDGKTVQIVDEYTSSVFGDGYIYFTKTKEKQEGQIEGEERYNKVYRKAVMGGDGEEVLLTNGKNLSEDKYIITLNSFKDGHLFYSKNVSAGSSALELYFAYKSGIEPIQLTYSECANPFFIGFDSSGNYRGTIIYKESQLWLLKAGELGGIAVTSIDSGFTYLEISGNVLCVISSDRVYKINVFDESGVPQFTSKVNITKFTLTIAINNYMPKIIGNYVYFIGTATESYYSDYMYRHNITLTELDDEYIPERLGVMSKEDIEAMEEAEAEE